MTRRRWQKVMLLALLAVALSGLTVALAPVVSLYDHAETLLAQARASFTRRNLTATSICSSPPPGSVRSGWTPSNCWGWWLKSRSGCGL
ncbi:hypothetical protein [Promineifilum sp.]|uniref:hypothetical protein n=1 Tax=Promineifilum sp. TaxID=2664178 RepID=UPI0035B1DF18